ncbi:MAG: hypothetical protein IPP77_10240 [Bacteroidetes bacterium]|nr:hypothetical protein [Bacteroidota bacterium]
MKEAKRQYKMSDAKLIQTSDNVLGSANRDLAELATYGVDAGKLAVIEGLRDTFDATATDEELMGDLVVATDNRNEAAELVRGAIRPIAARFAVKYGEDSGQYRALRMDSLSQQDVNDLVRTARVVSRRSNLAMADLAGDGLTGAIVDDLNFKNDSLDNLIDVQIDAVKNRDIAVDDRIKKGNELYTAVVKLAEYGKSAWLNVNEAKYNDYVLNESSKKNAQVLEGTVAGGMIVNLSATDIKADTDITVTVTGSSLRIYFSNDPAGGVNGFEQIVFAGTPVTVKAGVIGFATGLRERLNLYNADAPGGGYHVVVEA